MLGGTGSCWEQGAQAHHARQPQTAFLQSVQIRALQENTKSSSDVVWKREPSAAWGKLGWKGAVLHFFLILRGRSLRSEDHTKKESGGKTKYLCSVCLFFPIYLAHLSLAVPGACFQSSIVLSASLVYTLLLNHQWPKSDCIGVPTYVQGIPASQWITIGKLRLSPKRLLPLSSCLIGKDKTQEQPFPETTGMRGISKTLIQEVQQSKTRGNLKVGERKKKRKKKDKKKKRLIIKCCLCKMKNHIVASGHNSPGKSSTISQDRKQCLCREEEQQLHLPNLPAISSERLSLHAWLLMLQANIPEKVFSPYKMYLPLPLPLKWTSSPFFYLPCFFLPSLPVTSVITLHWSSSSISLLILPYIPFLRLPLFYLLKLIFLVLGCFHSTVLQ